MLSVPQMFRLEPLNQLVSELPSGDGLDVIDRAELIAEPMRGAEPLAQLELGLVE